jgi:hypothetical protein
MQTMTLPELVADLKSLGLSVTPKPGLPQGACPPADMLDRWARAAALAEPDARQAALWAIREAAHAAGLIPASIHDLYVARGKEHWSNKTVPAMNLRGWTYQTSRAAFRAARKRNAGLLIFEQALAEAIYAAQSPAEYTAAVLAAGLREGHRGPIFLQADHDQINAGNYAKDATKETERLSAVIREQIAASFFNIDVDASTVVDLSLPTLVEQQRLNAELTAKFTRLVRTLEPTGVTISVGAEIGEVGAHNTTPDELRAFMATYPKALAAAGGGAGITKVSVNSGTYHGGKVLADGTLAKVPVAFDTLADISRVSRTEFGLAGAVQHGASTLPMDFFGKFPESGTVEIHLALGFNNLIFDHPQLPQAVKDEIRAYCFTHHANERKPDQTEAQFIYTTRKKAWAGMKQRFWDLPGDTQETLMGSLEEMFGQMFDRMNVEQTLELVRQHTKAPVVSIPVPESLRSAL